MRFFINPRLLGDAHSIEEIESASAIQSEVVFHFGGKKIVGRLDPDQRSLPNSIALLSDSGVKEYPIIQLEKFQVLNEGIADYFGPPIFTQ
jgi:hypothetical protein